MNHRKVSERIASRRRSALTLLELVVVMVVLVALAGMTLPLFDNVSTQSRTSTTLASLRQLQTLILNTYVPNMKGADIAAGTSTAGVQINPNGLPRSSPTAQPMLIWLFHNPASSYGTDTATQNTYAPVTQLGWNGPYLMGGTATYPGLNPNAANEGFTTTYGTPPSGTTPGDQTVLDGWGNPIVIVYVHDQTSSSYYSVLLSAGANLALDSTFSTYPSSPVPVTIGIDPTTGLRSLVTTGSGTTIYYPYWLPLLYYPNWPSLQ